MATYEEKVEMLRKSLRNAQSPSSEKLTEEKNVPKPGASLIDGPKTIAAQEYDRETLERAIRDTVAQIMPAQVEKPKRDAAAYEQAKNAARMEKVQKGYPKAQEQAAQDRAVMEADLAELESWTDEERDALATYVNFRQNSITSGGYAVPAQRAYNMLADKYGRDRVDELAYSWQRNENAKATQALRESSEEAVEGKTGASILHSAATIPANLLGAVTGVYGVALDAATRDKRYQTLDPNNVGNMANVYTGAVRGQVAENISGDKYDEEGNKVNDGGALRQVASIGYQGMMSLADSVLRSVAFGTAGGAGLAATSTFAQTVSEASSQGATPQRAVMLGIAKAGMEYLSEKIPMDEVFEVAKGGKTNVLRQMFKQAGIEITTEELSLFGSMAAEAVILQEKSSYKQRIGEAIANGASYEEAKKQADWAVWNEVLNTAAVSAFFGAVSGGGSAIVGNVFGGEMQTPAQTRQAAEDTPAAAENTAEPQQETAPLTQEQVIAKAMEAMGAELGAKWPKLEPVQMTEGQKLLDNAIKMTLGMEVETEQGNTAKSTGAVETDFPNGGQTGYGDNIVDSAQSQFKHDVRTSKVYENTYKNATGKGIQDIGITAEVVDPDIAEYDSITEKESFSNAVLRTKTKEDIDFEYDNLLKKSGWSSEDNDTAFLVMNQLQRIGDYERLTEIARKQRTEATTAGQLAQSFAKYTRTNTTSAAADAILEIDQYHAADVPKSFYKNKDFKEWKVSVKESILAIANEIEAVKDGDSLNMRSIIQDIAQFRKTTAWAGYSSELTRRTTRGLAKMDFDTLKTIATTQLAMIPSDFRKRSTGEIIKAIRVENMLFTLTTKFRNDAGNIANGIMDAVSDSFGGRMIDALLSTVTGQRTVANDIRYAGDYIKAARDAADVAAAFVSLDIPMEHDAKYATGKTRTFTPSASTLLGRMLSAYEKHLRYALEVSDKFYEGGTTHVVNKSLQSLGKKSGLTAQQIQDIAQKTGERRTFKDPGSKVGDKRTGKLSENGRALARTNVGVQKALNNIGIDGFGFGDLVQPFAAVSGEVKQVALDYSGGGMVSGFSKIIGILKDAKQGVPIDPYRQRSAATDFARGMSGVGLIAAFAALSAAGAISADDKESKWNLDASLRWWQTIVNGGTVEDANASAAWNDSDETITLDFLDPFNTQIHIGYLLSQGEDIPTALLQGGLNALLDMPVMDTFSEMADLQQTFTEISEGNMDGVYDAAGQLIGTAAGSVVPNWVRKTAQVIDPYYRDTYDTNPIKKAGKEVLASIPFASTILPKRYDNLGEVQRRYEEGEWLSAAIDNLVTPWDTDTYSTNYVYQEIERINALDLKDIDVTPPRIKRKFSYTDNSGKEHKDYNLSSDQYDTMQQVQGQTAAQLLARIFKTRGYRNLTDEQKAYTIKAVYEYAQEQGKKEALPDYYSKADLWIQETRPTDTDVFIKQGTIGPLKSAVDNAVNSLAKGWKVTDAAKKEMDATYDSFEKMSAEVKRKILENAVGDTLKYLEVRSKGATTQNYLDAVQNVKELGQNAKDAEIYTAVAATPNTSDSVKDALMKAYMTDYDPESSSPNKTELKYDYMREEMGISPEGYAKLMEIYSEVDAIPSKEIEGERKDIYISQWMEYGLSRDGANELYNLLVTNGKSKIDVVSWHNGK